MTSQDHAASQGSMQHVWARRADIPALSSAPGVFIQPVFGESIMTCWIKLEPGAVVPAHSHVHEQSGVVIAGTVTLVANGESRILGPGEAYLVTPNVEHSGAAGPEGAELVESFVPIREDFRQAWEAIAAAQ